MVDLPRTPKQRAIAWARAKWGSDARYGKDQLGRYLIGVREPGFLGEGLGIYGAGDTWEEALEDVKLMVRRGWTNSPLRV